MDLERLEVIKRYVGFDEESATRLREFHDVAEPEFEAIANDFYGAIGKHPEAKVAITGGAQQISRLKKTLVAWMSSILTGPLDQPYLESHLRIGRVHVRIGLEQEFMFTAMNRIRSRFTAIALRGADDTERTAALLAAIGQVLDLELAIMLDSYREDMLTRIRLAERREVAEAVPAFVLALDNEGKIQLWNHALERATGYDRQEMIGQPGEHLIGADTDRKLPLKNGGHRIVRWQCARPPSASGWTYAMGADVTEERVMLRRTLRAERLAAVGTLAAGLAHEVRNPLNSATLQLQVLRRRIERGQNNAEALIPVCDVVHDEIRRLDRLVTDFLAFAQKRPLDLRPTRINDLVKAVVDMIRPEAASANVSVKTELSSEARVVEAEPERLRQLLLNLTRNALEAMAPQGGGTLSVHTGPADVEGYVTIDVEDTGPGFSEDAPIFDAFYTTKPTGTGLGLAIVHRIVSDHGGTITAQSRPGQTRFTIRLAQQAAPREA